MANICCNKVAFVGGKESVLDIMRKLQSVADDYSKSEFAYIKDLFRIEGDYPLRGAISEVDDDAVPCGDGLSFVVWVDTAWHPELGLFEAIAKKYGDVEVSYIGVEPGCGVFQIKDNRNFFGVDYYVYIRNGDELPDELMTFSDGLYPANGLHSELACAFGVDRPLPELIAMATANDAMAIEPLEHVG